MKKILLLLNEKWKRTVLMASRSKEDSIQAETARKALCVLVKHVMMAFVKDLGLKTSATATKIAKKVLTAGSHSTGHSTQLAHSKKAFLRYAVTTLSVLMTCSAGMKVSKTEATQLRNAWLFTPKKME